MRGNSIRADNLTSCIHFATCCNFPIPPYKFAVLHDILEDTATTAEDLKALGFSAEIIQSIQALTKQTGESRLKTVKRTVLNPLATQVKYVDVLDNMNLMRINNPTARDFARLEEYKEVLEILKQAKNR